MKGGEIPRFCANQMLRGLPASSMEDASPQGAPLPRGLTVPWTVDPFPGCHCNPSADVQGEDTQAGAPVNRRNRLLCRCH